MCERSVAMRLSVCVCVVFHLSKWPYLVVLLLISIHNISECVYAMRAYGSNVCTCGCDLLLVLYENREWIVLWLQIEALYDGILSFFFAIVSNRVKALCV